MAVIDIVILGMLPPATPNCKGAGYVIAMRAAKVTASTSTIVTPIP